MFVIFGLLWDFLKAVFTDPLAVVGFLLVVAGVTLFIYWTGYATRAKGRGFWKPTWPWVPMLVVLVAIAATPATAQAAHYRHRAGWLLPDSSVTPGVVRTIDRQAICTGTTKTVRHTTASMKAAVYAAYGITRHPVGAYEIDHLIPLELGGADTVANLWPQPARPVPGFHQKDVLENWLHAQICTARLSPDSAQRWIVHDFPGAYEAMSRAKAARP